MSREMRLPGGNVLLFGVVLLGCYVTPRSDSPRTADGGAAGASGAGGSHGGTSAGAGAGGASGSSGGIASSDAGASGGVASGGAGSSGGAASGGAGGASACNPACDATHVCTGGLCLLADAQQCVTASQCASGACNPFYRDVDGDGYGTGQAVGFCTLTTAPIGYATQTGDCCDDAANIALAKLIHPGADFQTTSAGGICGGITWDYDCDGVVETNPQTIACNNDYPTCMSTNVNYPQTSCGRNGVDDCSCVPAGNGTSGVCTAACFGHPGSITCK
jgi:hypothetical protein